MKLKTLIFYMLPDIFIKPRCIKNLNDSFWTKGPYMGKVKSKWKKARAEIENDKYAKSDICNSNSATRWHF